MPAAKNQAAITAKGEFLLFLYPNIFPKPGAIETLLARMEDDSTLSGITGQWSNAAGKVEVGYNIRRFPTFFALIFDILLINKLLPSNPYTRRYKMHDFAHDMAILAEHANDWVFMVRRQAILRHGGFNEEYSPRAGSISSEFCQTLNRDGERILYEPRAQFVASSKVSLMGRLVRDQYPDFRRSENLYIRKAFRRDCGLCCAWGDRSRHDPAHWIFHPFLPTRDAEMAFVEMAQLRG